ncbi:hypothetical protein HK100_003024 [Physocladia obscura]|uniref:L domain-like protein n=1 Tax=Physocladia obscura TaxID=109957 RepID=A0AAD5SUY8_9FUNG|nr:hypothetical protein HK100_003024 [Physocladia obscura]
MSIPDCVSLLSAWPEIATTAGATSANCCSVSGVTCTNDRITALFLNGYSYTSAALGVKTYFGGLQVNAGNPIPTALFELTEIGNLWMAGVGLTGPIPTGFGKLTNLVELHIESNSLTGGFPDDWADLKNLLFFHADNNQLSGELPGSTSIAATGTKLQTFLVQNNSFTGDVPDAWIEGLMDGVWIDLYGNCLTGVSAELNSFLCNIGNPSKPNCAWFDLQNPICTDNNSNFMSKCWEVNPNCPVGIIADEPNRVINVGTTLPSPTSSTTAESVVTTTTADSSGSAVTSQTASTRSTTVGIGSASTASSNKTTANTTSGAFKTKSILAPRK